MITPKQLADTFISDQSGGDQSKDSGLDVREVILKIKSYIVPLVKGEYFGKLNEGDKSAITQLIATYELSLEVEDTGQKFITIPDFYITLPYNKGIHRLYIKGNPFNDFVIMHQPGISGRLPHTLIKNEQFCYIEAMKVKMGPGCTAKKADKIILQLITPSPDTLGDNDPMPILNEHVAQIMEMLKRGFAPVAMLPNDMANDNNPNIK